MPTQTPEAIAAEAVAGAWADWYRPYNEQVRDLLASAIAADRSSRTPADALAAAGVAFETATDDEGNPSLRILEQHVAIGYGDDRACANCGDVVATLSSRDWCDGCEAEVEGLVECPNCSEFVEPDDMRHWPLLAEPVSMCGSCEHNARRSGWEPGR